MRPMAFRAYGSSGAQREPAREPPWRGPILLGRRARRQRRFEARAPNDRAPARLSGTRREPRRGDQRRGDKHPKGQEMRRPHAARLHDAPRPRQRGYPRSRESSRARCLASSGVLTRALCSRDISNFADLECPPASLQTSLPLGGLSLQARLDGAARSALGRLIACSTAQMPARRGPQQSVGLQASPAIERRSLPQLAETP